MEKYAFYTTKLSKLNPREMKRLTNNCTCVAKVGLRRTDSAAQQVIYQWPDGLQVVVNRMPGRLMRPHIAQLYDYLCTTLDADAAVKLARYLLHTKAVVAVVVKPGADEQGRVEQLLENLKNMTEPLIYSNNQLSWSRKA